MKICDICAKKVTDLKSGPSELQPMDVCEDCFQDFLRRLSQMEKRLAETKGQWRAEVITEWRREREPKGGAV